MMWNVWKDFASKAESIFRNRFMGMVLLLFVALMMGIFCVRGGIIAIGQGMRGKTSFTVVLDAGHGGFDPGKIGINGRYEKEINLAIAKEVQCILEQNDCHVIMTRTNDSGLCEESDSNKKIADLTKRVKIMNGSGADLVVSIHQNSFPQESSKGAQVFYAQNSIQGQDCAETIQKQLVSSVDPKNHRVAKANADYYLFKNSVPTTVIVECGFLSNAEEAKQLCTKSYQRKVAWGISLGVLHYLEEGNKGV